MLTVCFSRSPTPVGVEKEFPVHIKFSIEFPNALNDLTNWILEGKIKYNVDIQKGLENALVALDRLFTGDNTGKLILEVSKEEG